MANGILGTSEVPATTDTTVYTVPADTFFSSYTLT